MLLTVQKLALCRIEIPEGYFSLCPLISYSSLLSLCSYSPSLFFSFFLFALNEFRQNVPIVEAIIRKQEGTRRASGDDIACPARKAGDSPAWFF
jgi:hypothetical protein